jgi:hypothetical protein
MDILCAGQNILNRRAIDSIRCEAGVPGVPIYPYHALAMVDVPAAQMAQLSLIVLLPSQMLY